MELFFAVALLVSPSRAASRPRRTIEPRNDERRGQGAPDLNISLPEDAGNAIQAELAFPAPTFVGETAETGDPTQDLSTPALVPAPVSSANSPVTPPGAARSSDDGERPLQSAARRISSGLDLTTRGLGLREIARARVDEIAPGIYHVHFPTQHLLTSTFLRFQEHYESPKFRGKVFDHEEFMDWYAKTHGKEGHFTYLQDWRGFNIPSNVLKPFYEGKFDPLTRKEKALLDLFHGIEGRFYVIGTFGKTKASRRTLRHEIAHALYYIDPAFREQADRIVSGLRLDRLYRFFAKTGGYDKSVFPDEAQAYVGYNLDRLKKKGIDVRPLREPSRQLQTLQRIRLREIRRAGR